MLSVFKSIFKQKRGNINAYLSAMQWIKNNTLEITSKSSAIKVSHNSRIAYPEVTGYYIPTMIRFGQLDIACKFVNYLLDVQNDNGSFYNPGGSTEYTFDTGQALKGLWAFYKQSKQRSFGGGGLIFQCF